MPLGSPSGSVSGYKYAFAKPADTLEVRRVYSTAGNAPMEFRVVGNKIGANESSGKIEYVADVTDLDQWPVPIQECLVTRLACDAAMTLTSTPGIVQILYQKYVAMASHAAEVSIAEEQPPINRRADFRSYTNVREQ